MTLTINKFNYIFSSNHFCSVGFETNINVKLYILTVLYLELNSLVCSTHFGFEFSTSMTCNNFIPLAYSLDGNHPSAQEASNNHPA